MKDYKLRDLKRESKIRGIYEQTKRFTRLSRRLLELEENSARILFFCFRVYYESIKREPKIRGIKKCRCDERLQTKTKEFTRLPYT